MSKVLVVDDDNNICEILKIFLENAYDLINNALNNQIRDLYIQDETDKC